MNVAQAPYITGSTASIFTAYSPEYCHDIMQVGPSLIALKMCGCGSSPVHNWKYGLNLHSLQS